MAPESLNVHSDPVEKVYVSVGDRLIKYSIRELEITLDDSVPEGTARRLTDCDTNNKI